MNVFLYLEDIFVRLYFQTQLYIQRVQLFVQIDVGTTPLDFTTLLRISKLIVNDVSLIVKCRSLTVAIPIVNLIHVH